MKEYEEKGIKWLISKPRGLVLIRRRRSLRRAGGNPIVHSNIDEATANDVQKIINNKLKNE